MSTPVTSRALDYEDAGSTAAIIGDIALRLSREQGGKGGAFRAVRHSGRGGMAALFEPESQGRKADDITSLKQSNRLLL
jgi:hypothetical protein